ncbi:MAG: efflux RND transporter permease subunit, partial [Acidiferrobacterales bacterium]
DLVRRLQLVAGVRNVRHSAEDVQQEFAITIDRRRTAELDIDVADVGRALRISLEGEVASDFIDGDRSYDIRVRLPRREVDSPNAIQGILLFGESRERPAVYLRDVASIELVPTPAEIRRERQSRIIEVTGSLTGELVLGEVISNIKETLENLELAPGYNLYFAGTEGTLERGRDTINVLLGLALFLVFVVLAVQYESLRNPAVIMLSVPFAMIGVALGLFITGLPLSMPVWLGVIMLVGIVVNNAIVLLEFIEIMRARGQALTQAIIEAARLRLRPILMTTVTTVVGMMPLALGLGEGAEMLQPLAVTIVAGLSVSMLVSLGLVPAMYSLISPDGRGQRSSVAGPN